MRGLRIVEENMSGGHGTKVYVDTAARLGNSWVTGENVGIYYGYSDGSYDIEFNNTLLPGKAYYFEKEISLEDVNSGVEYALSAGDGYNPYIAYMDIGVNGDSTSTIANIANVDFVYTTGVDTYSKVTPTNLSGVGFVLEGEVSTDEFILTITRTLANGVQYIYSGSGVTVTAYGKAAKDRSSQGTFLE